MIHQSQIDSPFLASIIPIKATILNPFGHILTGWTETHSNHCSGAREKEREVQIEYLKRVSQTPQRRWTRPNPPPSKAPGSLSLRKRQSKERERTREIEKEVRSSPHHTAALVRRQGHRRSPLLSCNHPREQSFSLRH